MWLWRQRPEETALCCAAKDGNVATVQALLDDGVNIECTFEDSQTPLHYAAANGHVAIVRFLLEKGAKIEARESWNGATPLRAAANRWQSDVVRLLLEYGADFDTMAKDGSTPLHQSALFGYMAIVRLLLEKGAKVDAQTKKGETPLYNAARNHQPEIVRLLLDNGATLDVQDKKGRTPRMRAEKTGSLDAAELLRDYPRKHDYEAALWKALRTKNIAAALTLVKKRVIDPNLCDTDGTPLLHRVLEMPSLRHVIVENRELRVDDTDKTGDTALARAVVTDNVDVILALLYTGARVDLLSEALLQTHVLGTADLLCAVATKDVVSVHRATALHIAAACNHTQIVGLLLKTDASLRYCQDHHGNRPLHVAAARGNVDTIATLLDFDEACVDMANRAGESPLYLAARGSHQGHGHCVTRLLSANASCRSITKDGSTVLHAAAQGGYWAMQRLVVLCSDALEAHNAMGETPLYVAAKANNFYAVRNFVGAGADLGTAPKDPETLMAILQSAINAQDTKLLQALVPVVAEAGHVACLRDVLQAHSLPSMGLPKALGTEMRQKALATAVAKDKPQIVMDLLHSHGSELAIVAETASPLHYAAAAGSQLVLGMLLATPGLQINAVNKEGYTALAIAVNEGRLDAATALVTVGADASIHLPDGSSVLHAAVALEAHSSDMLQMLLSSSTLEIDQTDAIGRTALACAVLAERDHLVQLLVEAGADATLPLRNGQDLTILATAAQRRHQSIASYLNDQVHTAALDISAADITSFESLGKGGGGAVVRASYNDRAVAIKKPLYGSVREAIPMREEIDNTTLCRSPHVVPLLATVDYASNHPQMVLELMDQGDLFQYLCTKRKGEPVITEITTMQVAWAIANALQVIHGLGKVHRDVKSLNVFLSSTHGVKLGDFGTTRTLETLMTGNVGSQLWMAPEVFRAYDYNPSQDDDRTLYTSAADVYSFGIILSEVETGHEPYANHGGNVIADVRAGTLRPDLGQNCPPWLRKLATACWAQEASMRPTAKQIVQYLAKRLYDHERDEAYDDDDDLAPKCVDHAKTTMATKDLFSIAEEP
ncbi:TKL protein kinase [Saprolegnia diclina VS20]|uniref:TKL protein kinase n=1 Tax=Saprolegnia diclina (strain VS20) TaxID=1156394 RepID=T0R3P6_SAPDV|nr:TKL protein kinase [Saprolegnia diclina VS20]EQC26673.1 TKL protein kinase [Saprolegnia diclina VS20]|eukprot:XP_008619908.1 TKL protein kinase [Saprolegnia diclina VS20]